MYIQQIVGFLLGIAFTILVMAMPTIIQAFKKSKMRTASDGKEYELELNGSWADDDWDQPIAEESKKRSRRDYHNAYYHANREKIRGQQNTLRAAKVVATSNLKASAAEESRKAAILASRRKYYQENRENILLRKSPKFRAELAAEGKSVRTYEKRNIGISYAKDPNGYAAAHNKIYTRPAKKSSLVPPVTVPLITPPTYTYGTRALS